MHVMIDLETLSTRMNAAIISIGAVRFDRTQVYQQHHFYRAVTVDSNTRFGRHVSGETLSWWMEQSESARAVFSDPKAVHLAAALFDLADWLRAAATCNPLAVAPEPVYVWGNGANFDISILESAYANNSTAVPWVYTDVRCMRTVRKLAGAERVPRPEPSGPHHALADALDQAHYLRALWAAGVGMPQDGA
jgi:exodeoxyribonuclease VIII